VSDAPANYPGEELEVRTTIKDVARLAGVSVATVSAVANGKTGVSEKLRKNVMRAITSLNYHPDHVARGPVPIPVEKGMAYSPESH